MQEIKRKEKFSCQILIGSYLNMKEMAFSLELGSLHEQSFSSCNKMRISASFVALILVCMVTTLNGDSRGSGLALLAILPILAFAFLGREGGFGAGGNGEPADIVLGIRDETDVFNDATSVINSTSTSDLE
ncbi:hypothetical protein CHS0354_006756 [Potamilus streckersoni]|uniref:Uncharacterized protein n=1 Tax=Potamilus streckersoni TaxID=2493646 RepID=A0AAE0VS51_9BIVA|nr:hypothetical protein CHS0354_006756 [Potamilus streckersoni]